jgi:hypothetical protein
MMEDNIDYGDELDMATGGLGSSGDFDECGPFGSDDLPVVTPAIQVLPTISLPVPQALIDATTVLGPGSSTTAIQNFQRTYNATSGNAPLPVSGLLDSATTGAISAVNGALNPGSIGAPGAPTTMAGEGASSVALDLLMGRR